MWIGAQIEDRNRRKDSEWNQRKIAKVVEEEWREELIGEEEELLRDI